MAKIGSIKICKARVSTTHKKKCGISYTVNHKMQKFCSPKCRNRNNRITKSDAQKKEGKLIMIASKKAEHIKTFRGQIELVLTNIKSIYDKMSVYMNLPKPVLKKKDKSDYGKIEIYKALKIEFQAVKDQVPSLKGMLDREVKNLAVLLTSKWKALEDSERKEIEGIVKRVKGVISSEYYKDSPDLENVFKNSLKEFGYYENSSFSNIKLGDLFSKARRNVESFKS